MRGPFQKPPALDSWLCLFFPEIAKYKGHDCFCLPPFINELRNLSMDFALLCGFSLTNTLYSCVRIFETASVATHGSSRFFLNSTWICTMIASAFRLFEKHVYTTTIWIYQSPNTYLSPSPRFQCITLMCYLVLPPVQKIFPTRAWNFPCCLSSFKYSDLLLMLGALENKWSWRIGYSYGCLSSKYFRA